MSSRVSFKSRAARRPRTDGGGPRSSANGNLREHGGISVERAAAHALSSRALLAGDMLLGKTSTTLRHVAGRRRRGIYVDLLAAQVSNDVVHQELAS